MSVIINSIRALSSTVRLNPTGGNLLIQKYVGATWVTVGSYGELGNSNNEFRWTVDGTKLKVQQIKDGGSWSGTEGVDFATVTEYNEL